MPSKGQGYRKDVQNRLLRTFDRWYLVGYRPVLTGKPSRYASTDHTLSYSRMPGLTVRARFRLLCVVSIHRCKDFETRSTEEDHDQRVHMTCRGGNGDRSKACESCG